IVAAREGEFFSQSSIGGLDPASAAARSSEIKRAASPRRQSNAERAQQQDQQKTGAFRKGCATAAAARSGRTCAAIRPIRRGGGRGRCGRRGTRRRARRRYRGSAAA